MLPPGLIPSLQTQQPTYPRLTANVDYPKAIQLMIEQAPGVMLTITIGADTVEQWLSLWQQAKVQDIKLIQAVQESRNGQT